MAWLHTWTGVVLGALLFTVFWMGTLSVFDREIDRWMMPDTRLTLSAQRASLNQVSSRVQRIVPTDVVRWQVILPSEREPVFRLAYRTADRDFSTRYLHFGTAVLLPDQGTRAGTGFIFPFHFSLHLRWKNLGFWLVGLAGMATLVLLVSGLIIHRKIFADFFVFRPGRKLPRSSLDLHNLTGVLALPFHLAAAFSGLVIFFAIYFPTILPIVYEGDRAAFDRDAFGAYWREASGRPGRLASLDAMAAVATRYWGGEAPYLVRVENAGDESAYVEFRRSVETGVSRDTDRIFFDGPTGTMLQHHTASPVVAVQRFIAGMHFIQFEHWPLRWLYFLLGLTGCVMIATGFVYWIASRRNRHSEQGLRGLRLVEGLVVGASLGIVIATLAFLVANRLLPKGTVLLGIERHALEIWIFYLVWLGSFAHAWMRPGRAWREQCWAVAGLAFLAPTLNAVTTGDHLASTLSKGVWSVAGVDLALIAGGGLALLAAWRLRPHAAAKGRANELTATLD